jgi:signal transduction histidine kinase
MILVTLTLYVITLIYFEYRRDREGIKIFLLGSIIFTVIVINDILHSKNIIVTGYLIPVGLVIFIFFQSFNLSSRFSKAFEDVKTLSSILKLSNQELELNKERATKAYLDLEASQKQLVQSDKMITLGTMVAGVAHEINTPLGAIKANSENILESLRGLIQKLNPTLSHLTIGDLHNAILVLELTKESGTAYSSREARILRKKVISILEERGQKNVDLLADYIIELGLVEALERKENIISHTDIEKYLSIAGDLYGIRKKSSVIQNSAERVSKIVKSLKSFMHFDQNEIKVVSDLTEGMETVLIILHNKIKYGIEVIKNYGENVPHIYCYPDELNQVWTNLIHNAIQAMHEKGTLQIDIEKVPNIERTPDIDKRNPDYKGEYIAVSIQDSGSGISPEIRSKIFQAFFTTKPAGEGSGLGLHIIGKILEKHEGALYLESEPGKTRFTVVLPA